MIKSILFAGIVAGACASRSRASVINILPLGDSITEGIGVPGGYETQLYEDLTGAGQNMLYLGASTANPSQVLLNAGENHQAGYDGAISTYIFNNLDGDDNSDPYASSTGGNNGGYWLTTNSVGNPNFVLLDIGSNDVSFSGAAGAANALIEIGAILDKISLLRPDAHIIVANITQRLDAPASDDQIILDDLDPFIPGLVAQHAADGQLVSFVDMESIIDPSTMLSSDQVHPNALGYATMGNAWFQAIQSVEAASVPEPASIALLILGLPLLGRRRR